MARTSTLFWVWLALEGATWAMLLFGPRSLIERELELLPAELKTRVKGALRADTMARQNVVSELDRAGHHVLAQKLRTS